jgi:hypothetical protein
MRMKLEDSEASVVIQNNITESVDVDITVRQVMQCQYSYCLNYYRIILWRN